MATPEERKARTDAIRARSKTASPSAPPTTPPKTDTKVLREEGAIGVSGIESGRAEDALRRELRIKFREEQPVTVTDAAIEEMVTEEMNKRKRPPFVGGFVGPVVPTFPLTPAPSVFPETEPLPPGESLFWQTMRPQVRAPKAESPFNDVEFEKTLTDLTAAEKKQRRLEYAGVKAAYERISELNPAISTEDIFRDIDRQLQDLDRVRRGEGATVKQDPRYMGNVAVPQTGDPIEAVFRRTVKKGEVPRLEPGQMAFLTAASDIEVGERATADRRALSQPGVKPIMEKRRQATGERGPGGRPVMEEFEVLVGRGDYTPAEVSAIVARKKAAGAYGGLEWWEDEKRRAEVLAAPEKFAKGGVLFQKEYPTGATVESPVGYVVRQALSPLNAAAGAVGYLFTPTDIQAAKSADRPKMFRGTGLAENVLYNVREGGGHTQEIGDLYKYHPDPSVREYEWVGRAAGFGADALGLGDLAFAKGLGGGVRAARATAAASRLAEGAVARGATAEAFARGAAAAYLDSLPGTSRLVDMVAPGDVRLVYGARVADEFAAASRYKAVFDEAARPPSVFPPAPLSAVEEANLRIQAHAAATDAVRSDRLAATKFADDLDNVGPDMRRLLDEDYFTEGQRAFAQADEVAAASRKLEDGAIGRGGGLTTAEQRLLKPYIQAAVKGATPTVQRAVSKAFASAGKATRVTASEIMAKLMEVGEREAAADFAFNLRKAAEFEAGVKLIDGALAKQWFQRGPIIALTPKTFASAKAADAISAEHKGSRFYTEVMLPVQDSGRINIEQGGKVVSGYAVPPSARAPMLDSISAARAGGALTAAEHARMVTSLENGVMSADDLRLLNYTEVDALALKMEQGISQRALAEVRKPELREGVGPETATRIAQTRRSEEIQSNLPRWMLWIQDWWLDRSKSLAALATATQRGMIEDARRQVSALDRVLRDDYQRISNEAEFAGAYGLTLDASPLERLIALGRGTTRGQQGKLWASQFLESIIYGTKRNPIVNAFLGDYKYGDNVLRSVREYNQLIDDIARMTPQQTAASLDEIFARARAIVEANVNPLLTTGGGRALVVPTELSTEALAVAYARTRANLIVAETATRLIPERGIGLTDTTREVIDALAEVAGGKPEGAKLFYEMVKREAAQGGYWDELWYRTAVDGERISREVIVDGVVRSIDSTPLADAIEDCLRSTTSLTDQQVVALRNLLEYSFMREVVEAGPGMFDDVVTHVDLMRAEGLLHNTNVDAAIARVDELLRGKVDPSSLILPELREMLLQDLGKEPKYSQLVKELARLSDLAHDGDVSAARAVRTIRQAMDSYHSFYYYMVLSAQPRFHGVNNLTAPLITYFTTGRVSNVLHTPEAANILLLGAPRRTQEFIATEGVVKEVIDRSVVVVTDRLGNQFTRGDLFDLAVRNGVFRSQMDAEVGADFIAEANKMVGNEGKYRGFFVGRRALLTPAREMLGDPLATFTDNVWRMESITGALRNGKTIEEALVLGRRSLFDYSNLTEAERVVSRNFFVFYNYWRQSIGQFVRNIVENPMRNVRLLRATSQTSRIMIGDDRYDELGFYYPPEFGMTRIVAKLQPAAERKQGVSVSLPMMPHADALNIAVGLLTNPIATLVGPVPVGSQDRAFETGLLTARLGPLTRVAGSLAFNDVTLEDILEVKLSKNRIPAEHVALLMEANPTVGTAFLDMFEAKAIDPQRGENSYKGKAFETTDEGFERYKMFITAAQTTGANRFFTDYGKIVGGQDLQGAYPKTNLQQFASATGAATFGAAVIDEYTQRKAQEARAQEMKEEAGALKKARLPQREKDVRR